MSQFNPGGQCQLCHQVAPKDQIRTYAFTFDENDELHQSLIKNMPIKIRGLLRHGIDKIGVFAHAEGYGCQS